MTNPEETMEKQKKYFEANLLDGDAIQGGQMLSAKEVWEVVKEMLSLQKQADYREFEKVKLLCPACDGEAEIRQFVDGELETSVCGRCKGKRYIVLSQQRIALKKMKGEA